MSSAFKIFYKNGLFNFLPVINNMSTTDDYDINNLT